MFVYDSSMGGLDLFAQMLAKVYKLNVGILIFILDTLVIVVGRIVLTNEQFLLSLVTITAIGLATTLRLLGRLAIAFGSPRVIGEIGAGDSTWTYSLSMVSSGSVGLVISGGYW